MGLNAVCDAGNIFDLVEPKRIDCDLVQLERE